MPEKWARNRLDESLICVRSINIHSKLKPFFDEQGRDTLREVVLDLDMEIMNLIKDDDTSDVGTGGMTTSVLGGLK